MNRKLSLKEIFEYQYSDFIWDKAFFILDKNIIEYCREFVRSQNDKKIQNI